MAIAIPKSGMTGRISQEVQGGPSGDIGGRQVGEAFGQIGKNLHQLGTQILQKRKAIQADNFAAQGAQDYMLEKEEQKQLLETKYNGTSAEGYHREFKEWNNNQIANTRSNAPTDDALRSFNNAIASAETNTLTGSNARELEMFIDFQIKDVPKQGKVLRNQIVGTKGRALRLSEDAMTIQLKRINSLQGQTGMSQLLRDNMEQEEGNATVMAFGKAAVRKLHVKELSAILGPSYLTEERIESLTMLEKTPEDQALIRKTLNTMAKGQAGVSTLEQYIEPKQKEALLKALAVKLKAKKDERLANYNILHGHMKANLEEGGRSFAANPEKMQALGGLMLNLSRLDKGPIYKADKAIELTTAWGEGILSEDLAGMSKLDGQDAISNPDELLEKAIAFMGSSSPPIAQMLQGKVGKYFGDKFKQQMSTKLQSMHNKMWGDIEADPAQGLYNHNPIVKQGYDAWSKALADGENPIEISRLWNEAQTNALRIGKEMDVNMDDLGTGIPGHIKKFWLGQINSAIDWDSTGKSAEAIDAHNMETLGLLETLKQSTRKITTDKDGNEVISGSMPVFWNELADEDPNDSFTREMRFVSQFPEVGTIGARTSQETKLKLDTMKLLSKAKRREQNIALSNLGKNINIKEFSKLIGDNTQFKRLALSLTTGQGTQNQPFVGSMQEILTRALVENVLGDPKAGMAGIEKSSDELRVSDLVSDEMMLKTMNDYIDKQYVSVTDAGGTTLVAAPMQVVNTAIETHFPRGAYTKAHKKEYTIQASNEYKNKLSQNIDKIYAPPFLEARIKAKQNVATSGAVRDYTPTELKQMQGMTFKQKRQFQKDVQFKNIRAEVRQAAMEDYINGSSLVVDNGVGVQLTFQGNPVAFKPEMKGGRLKTVKTNWQNFYGDKDAIRRSQQAFDQAENKTNETIFEGASRVVKTALGKTGLPFTGGLTEPEEVSETKEAKAKSKAAKKRGIEFKDKLSGEAKTELKKQKEQLEKNMKGGFFSSPQEDSGL